MKDRKTPKKRDKKWKDSQSPVENTDALSLQLEILRLELCSKCQVTYPRDIGSCPSC